MGVASGGPGYHRLMADHSEGARPVGLLSFVVPAYREESGIADAVDAFVSCGENLVASDAVDGFEVVVVDDGSDDSTLERLAPWSADPRLVVVRHDENRGLGAALRSGFDAANGSVVVYIDADMPFDLAHVGEGLDLMANRGVSVVTAYRLSRRGEGLRRFLYSLVYNAYVRRRFGLDIIDVNFAGKFLTRDVLEELELESEGSFIDVEILARLAAAGVAVEQFGVSYRPRTRGVSTLSSLSTIRTILAEMRSIGPRITTHRPQR